MTSEDFAISRTESTDIEDLVDLWVSLADGQREYGAHLLPKENRTHIRDSIARTTIDGGVFVARERESDEIVGFVMTRVETGPYAQDVTRGVVENIFVSRDYRRRGIGSTLLAAAEDHLSDAACDVVALEAMADNEDARRFYRERGYEPQRVQFEKSLE